jgi:hypothetical protein
MEVIMTITEMKENVCVSWQIVKYGKTFLLAFLLNSAIEKSNNRGNGWQSSRIRENHRDSQMLSTGI